MSCSVICGPSGLGPSGVASVAVQKPSWSPPKPTCSCSLGTPLLLPCGYGCVVLTGIAGSMLVSWKSMKVSAARREMCVPNPIIHSDKCMAFNCVYRALASTLEIYPTFLLLLLTGGLEMPYFSTLGGITWILGRYIYAKGYYSGDPRKRANGSFFVIGHLMLLIATCRFAFKRIFS